MQIDIFLFIVFSCFALLSSLMVISLSNAVHSVLFLILVFCNIASLLLLLGAEFLSFMLLIVYVGAIAVLFLFVVMMLNIKNMSVKSNFFSIFPIGIIIFFSLFNQLFSVFNQLNLTYLKQGKLIWISWISENNNITNIQVIGNVLYTKYCFLFIISGLILLVAMIGAIVLTMHQRIDVHKQKIELQLNRNSEGSLKFLDLRN
uniref:NADH-ubiquinone oxidoreductase chain 6 n=2 Tax=Gracilaria tenuistipitata TaxID=2510778 RepID=A0A2S1PUQ7_GRATE|nr:NADH dehydrogenase subunit 6 [Gracilaria tenuistipitata]ARU07653.1 NADH dehydrogenase subunit 6 [Gracilaria tenuistipitata]AWH62564.1 NADH dehydrogenase subunit 6 [Gracilaria tenuistipitata]AWH62589.1 NADH dehydrogenase subunit 6 [Gracilaria tenuistipitata var. liui]AXI97775.1 NADH dehydrogenase subunit 6 [Gracilaria tenuistipitata]